MLLLIGDEFGGLLFRDFSRKARFVTNSFGGDAILRGSTDSLDFFWRLELEVESLEFR